MDTRLDIKNFTQDELLGVLSEMGEPSFRAKQIFKWAHSSVFSFDEMTNIPKALREKLSAGYRAESLTIEKKLISKIDGTVKYLFRLFDGNLIETVVMKYNHGNTICVSSQVGCNMGCRFCASAIGGKIRNLQTGEITEQILKAEKDLGIKISNIVMMGIGEPLDNYENVLRFLKNVNNPEGLAIGYRHITVSTCGVVPKIEMLAKENLPITLSVSLHSPFDEKRSEIMPINKKYPIAMLKDAMENYIKTTGRRISIEYALISGENDDFSYADEIIRLFSKMLVHINLIPVNPVKERSYKKSSPERVKKFTEYLNERGLTATVRRKLGADIDAACGQLRKQTIESRGDAF